MKKINLYILLLVNFLIIPLIYSNLNADEIIADKNKYTFNYDQEIPTLIRYGSIVSGYMSRTGYLGFIQQEDGTSRSSIDVGYNVTLYELGNSPSFGRLLSIYGFGYFPLIAELSYLFTPDKTISFGMISPVIGYSHSRQLLSWFRIGFSINAGPVYVKKISPWQSKEEFEKDQRYEYYSYEEWVEAYNAIGNVSGKWGGRLNPKVKLFFFNSDDNTVNFGLGFGYTQYVFSNNHFNSYDIGLDFSKAF